MAVLQLPDAASKATHTNIRVSISSGGDNVNTRVPVIRAAIIQRAVASERSVACINIRVKKHCILPINKSGCNGN